MIVRDPSQLLGKILTDQNKGKNSLYDIDVSSLWKNVEKKWCIIAHLNLILFERKDFGEYISAYLSLTDHNRD
jgi:hypothetical protein